MVAEEEEEEEAEAERAAARAGGAMSREEHQPAAPLQAGCRAHGAPLQARVAAAAGVAAGVGAAVAAAAGANAAADHPRRGETHPLKSRGGWLAGWTEEAEIEKKKIQIMQKPN